MQALIARNGNRMQMNLLAGHILRKNQARIATWQKEIWLLRHMLHKIIAKDEEGLLLPRVPLETKRIK